MTIKTRLTFISVVFMFAVIPGPTVVLVMRQAIRHGRASVIPLVLGVLFGVFVTMSLSLIGLAAVLAASATLYAMFNRRVLCQS